MWPISQVIQLSLDGQLTEFQSLVENKFREPRLTKTILTKLVNQDTTLILKFERSQARGIYAECELKATQQNQKILIQGKNRIPLQNFLLALYFPIIILFLLGLFKSVSIMVFLLASGLMFSLFVIYLSFANLKALQKELIAGFEALSLNQES